MSIYTKKIRELGLRRTIQKSIDKLLILLGIKASRTTFFMFKVNSEKTIKSDMVRLIEEDELDELRQINIYDFHNIDEIFRDPQYKILVAKIDNKIVGFCFLHYDAIHHIHGLCNWTLERNEAWLGPTLVKKEYRGQGVNSSLLAYAKKICFDIGIDKIYTCINSNNSSSQNSFKKNGFAIIGEVKKKKNGYVQLILDDYYSTKFQEV